MMCALMRFGETHNCWSFKWDSASGCIDMMLFLLRSLCREAGRGATNMDQAHL